MSKFYPESDKFLRDHVYDVDYGMMKTDYEVKKGNKSEIRNVELAQAYVPFQKMNKLFKPEEGLCKGTIFPELYKPYKPYKKY